MITLGNEVCKLLDFLLFTCMLLFELLPPPSVVLLNTLKFLLMLALQLTLKLLFLLDEEPSLLVCNLLNLGLLKLMLEMKLLYLLFFCCQLISYSFLKLQYSLHEYLQLVVVFTLDLLTNYLSKPLHFLLLMFRFLTHCTFEFVDCMKQL